MTKSLNYNVVIWNGTREVGIDADGTQHTDLAKAELFDEKTAREVAKKFGGKSIDAFADDDFGDDDF
jgi:hypothetical protein